MPAFMPAGIVTPCRRAHEINDVKQGKPHMAPKNVYEESRSSRQQTEKHECRGCPGPSLSCIQFLERLLEWGWNTHRAPVLFSSRAAFLPRSCNEFYRFSSMFNDT